MTDEELDAIEAKANAARSAIGAESSLQADCAYIEATRPRQILNLIADLRQARKERDWVITMALDDADLCSNNQNCDQDNISDAVCLECWRKAAREATNPEDTEYIAAASPAVIRNVIEELQQVRAERKELENRYKDACNRYSILAQ